MSFDPFEEKPAKAILKKACKGKKLTTFQKKFDTAVASKRDSKNLSYGGVSVQLAQECLALAEVVAAGRGQGGKVQLPVIAEDWLSIRPEFTDELAAAAKAAVDKIRTNSDWWMIVEDMGGWPAWTNYCRGLSTRLKKPAKKLKPTAKVEGIDAVVKRLRSKQCQFEMEKGHAVELRCTDQGQLADADVTDIAQLKKLRTLRLSDQLITDKSLGQLSALTQLRELEIEDCQVKGKGFKDLQLPRLRSLSIGPTGVNIALANCRHLTGLREVSFWRSDVTDKSLQSLTFATSLESIDIHQCEKVKGTGFKPLQELKKLVEVKAIGASLSRAGFEAVCGLKSLKRLDFMAAELPVKVIPLLENLKRLEELCLYRIPGLSDRELGFLRGLKKLRKLDLARNEGVTDETVKLIATLPQLEELSLWECGITPATYDMFLGMKKLKDLSVAQTGFSRAAEKRLMKAIGC